MSFFDSIASQVNTAVVSAQTQILGGGAKTRSGGTRAAGATAGAQRTPAERSNGLANCIPADVKMFSGCKDEQTSADVSDVSSFGAKKPVSAADKAGGACTNSLLSVLRANPHISFGDLLLQMQTVLKTKKYTQVPQLSSSKQIDLRGQSFSVHNPTPSGRTRALLIGINYFKSDAELSGCVNDVKQIADYLDSQNFAVGSANRRILTDDPAFTNGQPTAANIIEGMKWLVQGAQRGDALFFHFSGHGGQIEDDDGDEADGFDETLIPVDYLKAGQIRDDMIFKLLVAPLHEGTQLVALFDCCHSGTILDLPYSFTANDGGCQKIQAGQVQKLEENPGFNLDHVFNMITQVAQGLFDTVGEVQRTLAVRSRGLNFF